LGIAPSATSSTEQPTQVALRLAGEGFVDALPGSPIQSGPLTLHTTEEEAEFDSSLMALIAAGNELAAASLYDRHCAFVYSIALRILEPSLADECIHEVFMALWRTPKVFLKSRRGLRGALALQTCEKAIALRSGSGSQVRDTAGAVRQS
jgi:hypothetical protein